MCRSLIMIDHQSKTLSDVIMQILKSIIGEEQKNIDNKLQRDSSCSNNPSMTLFWYISCFPLVLQQGAAAMLDSLYWLERVLSHPQNDCQKKRSLQLKYLKSLYFFNLHIKEKCREMLQEISPTIINDWSSGSIWLFWIIDHLISADSQYNTTIFM